MAVFLAASSSHRARAARCEGPEMARGRAPASLRYWPAQRTFGTLHDRASPRFPSLRPWRRCVRTVSPQRAARSAQTPSLASVCARERQPPPPPRRAARAGRRAARSARSVAAAGPRAALQRECLRTPPTLPLPAHRAARSFSTPLSPKQSTMSYGAGRRGKPGAAKSKKFELTEEQKQEIREAFDLFDTDGSGTCGGREAAARRGVRTRAAPGRFPQGVAPPFRPRGPPGGPSVLPGAAGRGAGCRGCWRGALPRPGPAAALAATALPAKKRQQRRRRPAVSLACRRRSPRGPVPAAPRRSHRHRIPPRPRPRPRPRPPSPPPPPRHH